VLADVTVVVATRDRREQLATTLPRHAPAPVILVDNGSTDGTLALVADRFPEVSVLALGANRGAPARNAGVAAATTPYVAFADDDSWWAPGALARAAELFQRHPRLGLIAGRVLVGPEERLDPISVEMATAPLGESPDLPGPSVLGFLACAAVVRREAFLACGGFDDVVFFLGEEERLALDLAAGGWGLAYCDDVVAHHHPGLSGSRDSAGRGVLQARNRVLTALLRRPWPVVLNALRAGALEVGWRRLIAALLPAPLVRALLRRRRLPAVVEVTRRRLDADPVRIALTMQDEPKTS
jgi:GT2 family glycosyltransferase